MIDNRCDVLAYSDRIYAGTLGKILGVYLGRPVEGWTYDDIQKRFGTIDYFVANRLGVPLIVPDDDISGTFVFGRALQDNIHDLPLTSSHVAETWLNYIVENKTVLWWGGLSRSTEHTVFLRLKSGITAPESGSIELNGRSMAEQIGAQIFIDSWGLSNPGDPERAIAMARAAASVSHDGLAVEAAAFVAGMEAMAFVESDLDVLIEEGLRLVASARLERLVTEVRGVCRAASDWREVRTWIEHNHGYERYPSNSPIQTNHAALIMSLLMGGDSWQKSVAICTTAGWDTDSNTGNVGCLNGIRLGLAGLDAGADFRTPVADRMFAVSADGGESITDAVRETRKILKAAAAARGQVVRTPSTRFAFEYPGSMQGFTCHDAGELPNAAAELSNPDGRGLRLSYRRLAVGTRVAASVVTAVEPTPRGVAGTSYFEVIGSPSLYPTQEVIAHLELLEGDAPTVRFFVDAYDDDGVEQTSYGIPERLGSGITEIRFMVPDTNGRPVYRLGIEVTSDTTVDGALRIRDLDWSGAPASYILGKSYEMSPELTPWTTDTAWLRTFVSSAANLAPDYTTTFCVSHPERGGVVTTGTEDWADYSVASRIEFNQQDGAGLVARSRGHRRYYSAELRGSRLVLVKVDGAQQTELASVDVVHTVDERHDLEFTVVGELLSARWDGDLLLTATDREFTAGGAGFVVHRGAFLADGFRVRAIG
ncbi:MAG: ADP-ribosylglycohydrolase family protein [Microbacteriaceae bacterium]|nr:MAG: ADP-ribosylglycohydrolase family protein [Microbacteriaceae bacterium]